MSIFPEEDTNTYYFSRSDKDELLGSFSDHGFTLEEQFWPTVEHYFQATKFTNNPAYRDKICQALSPETARKLGESRWRRKRNDWKQVQEVVMTRGLYIKCRSHENVAQALLDTDDQRLVENSAYDYLWGCGRDRRGQNLYGKVLMNVRRKLREEQTAE